MIFFPKSDRIRESLILTGFQTGDYFYKNTNKSDKFQIKRIMQWCSNDSYGTDECFRDCLWSGKR